MMVNLTILSSVREFSPSPAAFCRALALVLVLVVSGVSRPAIAGEPRETSEIPAGWAEDATLRDVFFLSDRLGWAVGDRGTILRTRDGGGHWTPVRTRIAAVDSRPLAEKLANPIAVNSDTSSGAITCQLTSVYFVDEQYGWVVGRYSIPLIGRTRGVVLRTVDGGMTWQPVQGLVLPGLSKVQFLDRHRGWAVGDAGSLYRSGVYYTQDGGQTWTSQGESADRSWGDFCRLGDDSWMLLDQTGSIAVQRGNEFEWSVILQKSRPNLRAMAMANEREGWAVGARGAVFRTVDGGASWHPLSSEIDPDRAEFDFRTVAIAGQKVYFAGSPGNHLYSVDLSTGKVEAQRLPTRVPLHRMVVTPTGRLFGVGDLGTVIVSADGGQSWQIRRQSSGRLGMLVFADSPADIPFAMLARFSAEQNRICGVICLDGTRPRDIEPALSRIGCVAVDDGWPPTAESTAAGGSSERFSSRRLAKQIVVWRPDVVVACSRENAFELVASTREAIRAATSGDSSAAGSSSRSDGWSVERLIYEDVTGESKMLIDDQKLLASMGQILGDFVALSRLHVGIKAAFRGKQRRYAIEDTHDQQPLYRADPFVDLPVSPRRQKQTRLGNLTSINRAATKRQEVARLAVWEIHSPMDWVAWRSQIQTFAMGLEPDTLGIWLAQLAQTYLERGKTELCVATLEHFLTRVADHPLEPAVLLALARYYASDECGNAAYLRASSSSSREGSAGNVPSGARAVARPIQEAGATVVSWQPVTSQNEVASIGATSDPKVRAALRRERLERASRFLSRLKSLDPDYALSANVRWLEATILSKLQGKAFGRNYWQRIVRSPSSPEWMVRMAAREIRQLEHPERGHPWKSFVARTRPVLDGVLDDDVWQNALQQGTQRFQKVPPELVGGMPRTDVVWIAHDEEFLFLAARCHMIDGQAYADVGLARRRDADLSSHDRLEIVLDLDRDAACPFEMAIDHRGWGLDRVAGDVSWDPRWYIARSQQGKTWTVEAAIPWSQFGLAEPPDTIAARISRHRYDGATVWAGGAAATMCSDDHGQWVDWVSIDGPALEVLDFSSTDE